MKKPVILFVLSLALLLGAGCQTLHDTTFAPLQARLDSANAGGAQSMVLVNTSGQALHNVNFRAYMTLQGQMVSTPNAPVQLVSANGLPQRLPVQRFTFSGSANKLFPAQVIHFSDRYTGGEGRILLPVTKVQIVGSCDEGAFRDETLRER